MSMQTQWLGRLFYWVGIASLASFYSCSTTTEISTDLTKMTKVIEMSKGPCYGKCPVFTLTIYDNGVASYRGEQNTERLGLFIKPLPKYQFKEVTREFKDINLWQFSNFYRSKVPDAQTVTITYYESGDFKTVTGKDGRPEEIKKLETLIDKIAADPENWELIEGPKNNLPDYVIPNEVIVQLEEETKPEEWSTKYAKQSLKLIQQVPVSGYYWLFSFDNNIIPSQEMLNFLRQDVVVISAEFNRKDNNFEDQPTTENN